MNTNHEMVFGRFKIQTANVNQNQKSAISNAQYYSTIVTKILVIRTVSNCLSKLNLNMSTKQAFPKVNVSRNGTATNKKFKIVKKLLCKKKKNMNMYT